MRFWANRSCSCLAGLVLLASGCGVGEYENKMLLAQARQKRFDDENVMLEESPLTIPSVTDKDKTSKRIANFFLRPPKGISPAPVSETEPRAGLLYVYNPRKANSAGAFASLELAAGTQKDFAANVMRCFTPTSKSPTQERQLRHPLSEITTTFETTEFEDDQYFYSVNIWKGASNQIAIVYKIFKAKKDSAAGVVKMSLESFAVDQEANRRREQQKKGSPMHQVPKHPSS